MERRVIKFNLMGAIGVLLLIIASIVGITIFATNKNDSENKNNKNQQQIQENPDTYKEADMKESVEVNGEKVEFIVKPFESELKYKVNLASEKFYFDKNVEGKDIFKSLESDTIEMVIFKIEEGFKGKSEELIVNQAQRMKENETYRMNAKNLNGRLCYAEQEKQEDGVHFNYYIENQDSYFIVQVRCDENFANQLIVIVDKMLESFQIR